VQRPATSGTIRDAAGDPFADDHICTPISFAQDTDSARTPTSVAGHWAWTVDGLSTAVCRRIGRPRPKCHDGALTGSGTEAGAEAREVEKRG